MGKPRHTRRSDRPAEKTRRTSSPHDRTASDSERATTLKDMLDPEVLKQLSVRTSQWREEEARRETERQQAEERAKRAERKRLENDFDYLLSNSDLNWREYK